MVDGEGIGGAVRDRDEVEMRGVVGNAHQGVGLVRDRFLLGNE